MPASFLVVPQWQGSGSARAMRLVDGAEAIRGDLPAASTTLVDVPLEAGDALGTGVARFGSLQLVRDRSLAALADLRAPVITIGGDCGVELAAVDHAVSVDGADVAIIWFDAQPDLNTPDSSTSGAFTGMVLRALTGEGADGLLPATVVSPSRLVLAGIRSTDPGEDEFVAEHQVATLHPATLSAETLLAAIEATGAASVYIHIDLDVLDPSELAGLSDPVPFGISAATLVELIVAVKARYPLAGAGITAFSPASADEAADDLPTILRIIGALAR